MVPTANRMVPHGLLSIAAWLEKEGFQVSVYDCIGPKASPDFSGNIRQIALMRPDIVGLTATTSSFPDASRMAAEFKKMNPALKTVCGGVHCSALGGKLLGDYPAFDFLVMGEGERTMAEIAAGNDPSAIDGLVWRDGNRIVENKPRELIADLDVLPFPAYEKLAGFPRGYNLPLFSYVKSPGVSMVTSRGCMFQCSYCDRSVYKRGFRFNSAKYIYDHLKYLNEKFGIRHVNIYDDLFTADKDRIRELCEMLTRDPIDMQFNCAVRVGFAPPELLRMLKKAGCLMVSLGIESADPEMLKKHKAGVTLDAVRDTVRDIRQAGLRAKGLFIMGLPGETVQSIRRTSDFILSLGLDDMNMTKFTPFAGAPVWKNIRSEGTFEEDWEQMNCNNFVYVPNGIGSREVMDSLYNWHIKRFYTGRDYIRKFMGRLWQHRWSLWHILKHLPSFLSLRNQFNPKTGEDGHGGNA